MTRLASLRICLVPPQGEARDPWPMGRLADELAAAGHQVETSESGAVRLAPAPDVVHCFGLDAARDVARAEPSLRLVVTPTATDLGAAPPPEGDPLLAGAASAVVRSSKEQEHVHRLGVPWFRTWVVPLAVDVDTFGRLGPMANRTERYRLVAELSGPHDGVADALVAMARLDDVELVALVAEHAPGDDLSARVTEVRELAAHSGVSDRLAVVTPESAGERAWWLRSAHVAIAVPHSPRGSRFVAEAMACGTAVVATPVDALADLVVHGVTGLHVPVQSPMSLARAVRTVLQDEFTVEAYGMAAADRALSRFAWPRVVHELIGVYRRVSAIADGLEDAAEQAEDSDAQDADVVLDQATTTA